MEEINANNSNANTRNNILKNMWNQMVKRCFSGHMLKNYDLESLALCTKDCDNGHWKVKVCRISYVCYIYLCLRQIQWCMDCGMKWRVK